MTDRLKGKVALVTGGTNGIGEATVRGFVAQGAKVVFTGNNEAAAEKISSETGAVFVKHSVQDGDGWKEVMKAIEDNFGRLDIAFANAGIHSGDSDIETVSLEAWKNIVDVNLTGSMLTCQNAISLMKKNPEGPGGSIIINSSINGILALAGDVTYSTTKGALRLLAKSVAVHCAKAKLNIRCNTIHPGVVETPLIKGAIEGAPDPKAARAMLENVSPMGRLGQSEEIVSLVVYLGSDESRFVTGAEMVIDGGSTAGLPGV
ncbi:SDR family oxidoreductase [Emcibacter sp.]|uniref:SDR family oxidoreductase n=1 Tax=Emcibacter sp. TaxID=1979954 RepID=UPI002AA9132B|nr:SDR family oxidoreductase [Emcibacter sp.]